ncbi:MAG: ABC transporter permease [Peptococcaceae bacterium]|jgi:ABC-2 type transport system permease protein|nr:ABC transporter permease [Peptococcaceae bacterium]
MIVRKKQEIFLCLGLLILPSVASLLLGMALQGGSVQHVPFEVLDHDQSSLSQSLLRYIAENDTFRLLGQANSDEQVYEELKNGDIAAAIIIPAGFGKSLTRGDSPQVITLYDGTQMAAIGMVKSKVMEILLTLRMGYLSEVFQKTLHIPPAQSLLALRPVTAEVRYLGNPEKNTAHFFLNGILLNITQIAVYILAIELYQKPHSRRFFSDLLARGLLLGLAGMVSAALAMLIQAQFFYFPWRGSVPAALLLIFSHMVVIANTGTLLRIVLQKTLRAVTLSNLVMLMLLLSGYIYPVSAMPWFFRLVAQVVPFTYSAAPVRDILLLGYGWTDILPDWGRLLVFWLMSAVLLGYLSRRMVKQIQPAEPEAEGGEVPSC